MRKAREADRRSRYPHPVCECLVCAEEAHLRAIAVHHPHMAGRLVALSFLESLEAHKTGVYGGLDVLNLFD